VSPAIAGPSGPRAGETTILGRRMGLVALLSFMTNLAVLVKNGAVAARFGAGGTADLLAYGEAILVFLPTIILLRECFAIFVSIYGRDLETRGPEGAAAFSAAALRGVVLLGAGLSLVVLLAPRILLGLMAPGLQPEQVERGVWLLRWISPALLCQEISEFARCLHNAHHRYVLPGAILFVGNLLQAGLLVGMPASNALTAWILAVNGAALLQAAVLVLGAPGFGWTRTGRGRRLPAHLRPGTLWHGEYRRLGAVVAPVALGVFLVQIAGVIERAVLSYLPAGSLATLAYSRKLLMPIQTLLAASVALPIYVQMSRTRDENQEARTSTFSRGVQVDFFLMIPVTVLVWILAPEVVSLAFQRGLFVRADVLGTTPLLRVGVLAVLPGAVLLLLRDYLYTSGKSRPMVIGGAIQLVITGVANGFLALRYGLVWVPWGVVVGTWLTCLVLFQIVRRRHPDARLGVTAREFWSVVSAGAAAALAALGVRALLLPTTTGHWTTTLGVLLASGLAGVAVYGLVVWLGGHPLARAMERKLRGAA
jgi:peptidoglycan biosynthesis protein MviN/MurJ (putative lipid II flippase)